MTNLTSAATDDVTQKGQILGYLLGGGTLTPLDALVKFHCLSLSQRIGELKRQGYSIVSTTKVLNGAGGSVKRVAEYRIERRGKPR